MTLFWFGVGFIIGVAITHFAQGLLIILRGRGRRPLP